jgi:hypothetical protein
MRAAQLRVEYSMTLGKLMDFFKWLDALISRAQQFI